MLSHLGTRFFARRLIGVFAIFWMVLAANTRASAQIDLPPATPAVEEEGVETLTHGPIHEAFANPAEMDPAPAPSAPKEPPPLVPEEPPEYMPEGAIWIPGYWLWDDDRDEYIWITGVARVPPPNHKWIPGYFTEADGGWQRVGGFWVSTEVPEVEYRPVAPPESLEVGPSSPAPADDYFWIPGNWNYYDTGYRWQAGYWAPYQPDWIWVPARWVWTPAGFVYCNGFWDYRLAYRGQIFAPVYFQQPIYTRPNWHYRPWCVIPTNNLFIHLWIRPRSNCYYFGNYYAPRYADLGFVPWANISVVSRQRYIYDPFHSYAHVHYRRQGIDYIGRVQGWHRHFADRDDLRPPRTWREQQQRFAGNNRSRIETQLIAAPVVDVARRNDNALRFNRLDDNDRRVHAQAAERMREFNRERSRIEHTSRLADARLPNRGDDNAKGRGEGRPGADRADATPGRDNRDNDGRPGRGGPKLTIPTDLPSGDRRVARGGPSDDNDRGGKGDRGRPTPPPQPRAGRIATDATKGKSDDRFGRDDARDNDKRGKTAKTADRVETPPAGRTADIPETPGRRDRDDTPAGRGRDNEPGPGNIGRATDDDRGSKTGRGNDLPGVGRTPGIDRTPGVDRTPGTDRDRGGVVGGKSSGRGDDSRGETSRGPNLGDARGRDDSPGRGVPKVNAPGRAAETPSVGRPQADRSEGSRSLARPDAGVSPPAGTITPPTFNPNRLPRGGADAPGARTEPGRGAGQPDASRGRIELPSARGEGSSRPTFTPPRTGGSAETPRSPFTPRGNVPGAGRTETPRSNQPNVRPDAPRINIPDSRGRDSSPRSTPKSDNSRGRTESFRPQLYRDSPVAMPRVQPGGESRPMTRVEPPSAARSMPRIEAPRENRTPPRIETPRSRPDSNPGRGSRPEPRVERGGPAAADAARSAETSRGKGKGKDRD